MDVVVTLPLNEQPATGASTAVVDESLNVEVFFPVDEIRQRRLADGGGVVSAGEGFEGGHVDDGVVMKVGGKVEAVGDVGEDSGDAEGPIEFRAQFAS